MRAVVAAVAEKSLDRQPGPSEPWGCQALAVASRRGQRLLLSLDQTDLGNRFAVLMLGLVIGDRALPLTWHVEVGPANIGFVGRKVLLERIRGGLPAEVEVVLLANRFYPLIELFDWPRTQGWHYRVRLKGNPNVDPGLEDLATTGELAVGQTKRYLRDVRLFNHGVPTYLGILHEARHPEPWIIAMDEIPNRATVPDYRSRWSIEPLFSDLKSRGFDLEATQLRDPKRLDRLLLIMALALYWCVWTDWEDARDHPTPLEKSLRATRPQPLGVAQTGPQRLVVVQTRASRPAQTLANPTPLTTLLPCLDKHAELIGGEVLIWTLAIFVVCRSR